MSAITSASRNLCSASARHLRLRLPSSANVDNSLLLCANLHRFAQLRFARKVRSPGLPSDGMGKETQTRMPPPEEHSEGMMPEVPGEILDAWDNDEDIQEFLAMFASEELQGKKLLSHRDVAKLLECMGLSHGMLMDMITGQAEDANEDDPLDISSEMLARAKKGQKGGDARASSGGKGFQQDFDEDNFGNKGFGGAIGGKSRGFDSEFGGKGIGKSDFGGKSRGFEYDMGGGKGKGFESNFGGKGGGKGRDFGGKGGKGKRSDYEDFDDDFGSFRKGGRGGKSFSKGKF